MFSNGDSSGNGNTETQEAGPFVYRAFLSFCSMAISIEMAVHKDFCAYHLNFFFFTGALSMAISRKMAKHTNKPICRECGRICIGLFLVFYTGYSSGNGNTETREAGPFVYRAFVCCFQRQYRLKWPYTVILA